ncbi:MAG: hypothetical protein SGJ20_05560 [Planctomycetota bacterium]|nr:hypothetical protein [Planctomycetota bacterium]
MTDTDLRDQFAMHALNGLLASGELERYRANRKITSALWNNAGLGPDEAIVRYAFSLADQMLTERKRDQVL